jgi:hypothetical protein
MSFDGSEFAKMRSTFDEDPQNSLGIENTQLITIQSKFIEIENNSDPARKTAILSELKSLISSEESKFKDAVAKIESNIKSSYSDFTMDTSLLLLIRKNLNVSVDILSNKIKKLYETKLINEKSTFKSLYCGEESAFPEWSTWVFIALFIASIIIIVYLFTTKRYTFNVAKRV